MKKHKIFKSFTAFIAFVLLSVIVMIFITQGFSGIHRWGGFEYETDKYVNNNSATITRAYYPKKKMVIPSTICFYNVKSLGGYVTGHTLWGPVRKGMFEDDETVEEVIISEGIESVGNSCFNNAVALKSLEFPSSIKEVFVSNCKNLKNIKFSEKTDKISGLSFYQCSSIETVVIPENIAYNGIAHCAFYGCKSLKCINIPDNITTIQGDTFNDCISLKQLVLSKNIERIEMRAFKNCTSLEKITIYDKVKYIEDNAFDGCSKLTIYGVKGSYAQQYSNEHNIPFAEI